MREKPLYRPKNPPFRLPAAPGCLRTGALPTIRHAACGRLSGVAANRPNRANRAEEAGRANRAVGMGGGPERMGRIERMVRMARTGGLRRFACAECAKKVTRKAGATRRPGLSVVRDDRVTVSSSRGRCSDGPAAGCGGRAARTRRAGWRAPVPADRGTVR